MDKYIGKKLEGRYEIQELIGFGGMAIVFKAYDILEQRYVAVKILKDEYLENEDFKRRFRNESKAIALLSHPNIVKVYDVNFGDNIQYIVMEYIDGITLKEYIEQQKTVNWKEAVHFTVQILRALQHAHDNGIVHRDVKPQNVMLLEDGTIKVMDFGIARFARENGKTLSDKAIGSVHYISPEQARGEATDEKTDVYSVGVILYEMLTGAVPFDGDTPVSIAIKQMQIEPKRPTLINPNIPFGLEEIILRAMQKDPRLRYQTAAEMLRDIDEFKHNPDVVFEYKYFNQDGTTKYFDRLDGSSKASQKGDGTPAKKSYTMNILAGVTAACVILAVVALIFFFKALENKPQDLILPSLVGKTVEQAQAEVPGVRIIIGERQASTEYEENVIIGQKPDANSTVKVNSEVTVTVSTGIQAYTIPDFTNEPLAKVQQELEDTGLDFDISTVRIESTAASAGNVIMTDPPADTEVGKGAKIIIYVSLGEADTPVVVPELRGKSEVQARSELLRLGLNFSMSGYVDSNEPQGTVVEQTPESGDRVQKGTTISVKLSNGTPLPSEILIDITFPTYADDSSYDFDIYANGEYLDTKRLNPYSDRQMQLSFELIDGKINGTIDSSDINELIIRVNGSNFAIYHLEFTGGTYMTMQAPDFSLVSEFGIPENESSDIYDSED